MRCSQNMHDIKLNHTWAHCFPVSFRARTRDFSMDFNKFGIIFFVRIEFYALIYWPDGQSGNGNPAVIADIFANRCEDWHLSRSNGSRRPLRESANRCTKYMEWYFWSSSVLHTRRYARSIPFVIVYALDMSGSHGFDMSVWMH